MRSAVNPLFAVLAGFLARIPAGHAESDGLAAGFLSLLAVCILIEIAGWVVGKHHD